MEPIYNYIWGGIWENVKDKTVLVTGGAGFIGSHIVFSLAADNMVKVIDDLSTGKRENVDGPGIELFKADIGDKNALKRALKDVDYVFHLAAVASVERSIREPEFVHNVNLTSALGLIKAACDSGVKGVVFSSSAAVYGESSGVCKEDDLPKPKSPYAVQKLACEGYLRAMGESHGLRSMSLRYFNVYGPRQDPNTEYAAVIPIFLKRAINDESVTVFGDGEQTRDFCYVKDIAKANVIAMEKATPKAEVANIGTGNSISINKLIRTIGELCDSPLSVTYAPGRLGEIKHSKADVSKAERLLGYKPATELKTGLGETMEYLLRGMQK